VAPAPLTNPAVVLELGAESLAIDRAVAQARVIARGADLVLETAQVVALELELVQVEAEPEHGLVAEPELERGPVVPLEQVLVQVAAALRTKSVIAAHRPDLVPLLEGEEDLAAAVAETTHEPVAAEAAVAWAAAE
jgi:hypothetical protein